MRIEKCMIRGIPSVIWGEPAEKAYLFVHGKLSSKDAAAMFAEIAQEKGYQTLSFDLPERLEREGEVETPIDILSWDYDQYVRSHPVTRWDIPTAVFYGGRDNLQSRQVMEQFAQRFGCRLTVSECSKHPFMQPTDYKIVADWIRRSLELEGEA